MKTEKQKPTNFEDNANNKFKQANTLKDNDVKACNVEDNDVKDYAVESDDTYSG